MHQVERKKCQLFALFVGFWSLTVFAHPLDLGLLQIQAQGPVLEATFDLHPSAAAALLGLPNAAEIGQTLKPRANDLLQATLAAAPLLSEGQPCLWEGARLEVDAQTARLRAEARCLKLGQRVEWAFPFLKRPELPRSFQLMLKSNLASEEQVTLVEAAQPEVRLSVTAPPSFAKFLRMGIEHIGATPSEWYGPTGFHLPDGIDHILFLLALLLGGGGLWGMIRTVTGFTVGHSLTLALASFGVLHFPSRVIESAIALSIAYVAAENLFVKVPRHRWRIALLFGLVHGFGFANALTALHLGRTALVKALIGFNLGVELGQVVIVIALAPLVYWLQKRAVLWGYGIAASTTMIFFAGAYWFVQRAFGG